MRTEETSETYQPNAICGIFCIPIEKCELYKHLWDNIYETFGENLNIHWVFEDVMGLLAVISGAKNDIVFMLKKCSSFYRWFLKCLQIWNDTVSWNCFETLWGGREVGGTINKTGLTICWKLLKRDDWNWCLRFPFPPKSVYDILADPKIVTFYLTQGPLYCKAF